MKILPFAAALALSIGTAEAQQLYLQGDLGIDILNDNTVNTDVELQDGFGGDVGVRAGLDFGTIRTEIEAGLGIAPYENLFGDSIDYSRGYVAAGVYAGLQSFYVGGGVGIGTDLIEGSLTQILADDLEIEESATGITYHGEVGYETHITPRVKIVPHYRLTALPDTALDDTVYVHSFRVGFRLGL